MGKRKKESLGAFQRGAIQEGLTYAEAQKRETCKEMGRVRAPQGSGAGYMKVSTRERMRGLEGSR